MAVVKRTVNLFIRPHCPMMVGTMQLDYVILWFWTEVITGEAK